MSNIRIFHSLYKVGRNGIIVFKGFNNSKTIVASSGARPDARDYYWFRSPMRNHYYGLSREGNVFTDVCVSFYSEGSGLITYDALGHWYYPLDTSHR